MRSRKIIISLFRSLILAWMLLPTGGILQPATVACAADQAGLYGMITDEATKLPIEGVNILASLPGGDRTYKTRTDGFGMFRLDNIEPGTYALEANHPGYHAGSDSAYLIALNKQNRWQKELTLKAPFFDVFVEVACVTTGMKLKNIPVRVTVVPSAGGGNMELTGKTDETGAIHFPGLPKGFYGFFINQGDDRNPDWESYEETVSKELTGPHWADVLLKPLTSHIVAAVYGFNPVTEEENVPLEGIVVECEGVHPDNPGIVLAPAQVGVSGIRKEGDQYWDNTLAEKVRFAGLPHIHWMVRGKRLGYKMSETKVTAIPKEDLRIDMALDNTKLTVVVNTPYNDPEMLAGLKVRLQGLKNSNTAGIDRIRTVEYQPAHGRAVVLFDRILPGAYLATVADTVQRHVPILIEGNDINAGKANAYSKFSINLKGSDYLDAVAGIDRETTLSCDPEPMIFTGKLMLADELTGHDFSFFRDAPPKYYPAAGKTLEFRASEYYLPFMPEAYRRVEVKTNDSGEFTVTLLPGMYGIAAPELTQYWGSALELTDRVTNATKYLEWPYYQTWPYSLASASAFQRARFKGVTSIGGVAVSSGQRLMGALYALKKLFNAEVLVHAPYVWKSPTENQVLAIDREKSDGTSALPTVHYVPYNTLYSDIAAEGSVTLTGPVTRSGSLINRQGSARVVIEGLPAGHYTMSLNHPRYTHLVQYAATYPYEFTFAEFPDQPGIVPSAPFPEEYDVFKSVFPLGVQPLSGLMQAKNIGTAEVEIYHYSSSQSSYYHAQTLIPQFIRPDYAGNRIFYYTQDVRAGTPATPYTMWLCLKSGIGTNEEAVAERWYPFTSDGGSLSEKVYIGGPSPTGTTAALHISHTVQVEARDIRDGGDVIPNVQVSWFDNLSEPSKRVNVTSGGSVADRTEPLNLYDLTATHANWRYSGKWEIDFLGISDGKPQFRLTLFIDRGIALRGEVRNATSGNVIEGADIRLWDRYGRSFQPGAPTTAAGIFAWASEMGDVGWFLEVIAPGFEPFRLRLDPAMAVSDPQDPRTNVYLLEGQQAIRMTPLKKPVIAADTLTMNRKGAFLPGVKKSGNQTIFNDFNADGALTMTWSLDVGLAQKEYAVTLPGFDNADGSPGPSQTLHLTDGIAEVWLVDMKSFPNNRYNEEPVPLTLPGEGQPEPAEAAKFLANIHAGADGFKNVYFQRLTNVTPDAANPDIAKVTGKVKLWQLPPDLFRPAFIVVTKLGAVNVYPLDYTGAWAGRELTGARLPAWFAGMQDIMGTVAGYQGMMGKDIKDYLGDILPTGKIIALPTFTGNVILRATNTLDYVYSIDTQVKEGMADELGGILGLAPGFLGLSLYGGAEAILKGEDREFFLRIKGGVNRNSVNKKDYTPHFMKSIEGVKVELTPAPSGEFQSINSFKFDPDNRPDELAVLFGVSGKTGVEVSGSIFPVLKYIPKIGPVLYMLYKSGAIDIRALSKGLIGVRSLSGFKTVFPHQEEHYAIQGAETKQWRRHFLGGNEVGDPAREQDPEKPEKLEIAFGFGVGTNLLIARGSAGAKGTLEIAGDDVSWTGVPALLIDVNPNGDWPIVKRIRGDLRAVLDAYLQAWVVRFQKKWFWKLWPIDYQFGTESTLKLIEMEIITSRRDLGGGDPAEFKNESPVVVDKASPLTISRIAGGTGGDLLLYTDVTASGGDMVLKASLRQSGRSWGTPVTIGQVAGVVVNAAVIALKQGGWLAVWTEIARDQADGLYPPSKIMYAVGNAEGTLWTSALQAVGLENVADAAKLIPHGDNVALIYTEKKEGPTGGGDGLNAVVWDGNAWSEPLTLASSAVDAFDVLGSDDLSQRPTLAAYRDGGNKLHLLEWAENLSAPLLMKEEAGGALAFTRHNERTYLAYSMKDGGIGFFHRDGVTGPWADRGILFPEAAPRELSLTVFREAGRDLVVAAWTESDGVATHLRYGAFDATDETIKTTAPVTTIAAGDFRSPALHQTDGALELTAILQQADGVNQIHIYRLAGLMNPFFGDINLDGIVDLQDFIIVLRILIKDGPVDIPGKSRADVNQSGKIDLGDAIYILRVLGTR